MRQFPGGPTVRDSVGAASFKPWHDASRLACRAATTYAAYLGGGIAAADTSADIAAQCARATMQNRPVVGEPIIRIITMPALGRCMCPPSGVAHAWTLHRAWRAAASFHARYVGAGEAGQIGGSGSILARAGGWYRGHRGGWRRGAGGRR